MRHRNHVHSEHPVAPIAGAWIEIAKPERVRLPPESRAPRGRVDWNKVADVTEGLQQSQLALDLNFESKTYQVEVARKVLEAYMPNIEPATYDAVIEELERAAAVTEQARTYGEIEHEPESDV